MFLFFIYVFMNFSMFFSTAVLFLYQKQYKFFFTPDSVPDPGLPVSIIEDSAVREAFGSGMTSEESVNPSSQAYFKHSFSCRCHRPGKVERFPFHIPPWEQTSVLSSLVSLPHRSQSMSAPGVGDFKGVYVVRQWEGIRARPGELLALGGLGHDSEPSCSPSAPPLLLSASSWSPTLGSPSALVNFILRSKLFVSFSQDSFGWSHSVASRPKGSQAFKYSLGPSGENSEVASSSSEIPSICRLPQAIILHMSQGSVCAKLCAHDDFRWYTNKPFFNLTVCINFAVY